MHRLILRPPRRLQVDHRDGDPLNNTRGNLRAATATQNAAAHRRLPAGKSSRFRGVTWDRHARRWRAQLMVRKRNLFLGLYATEEDAALAYNRAAARHFRAFAFQNDVAAEVRAA